MSSAKNSSSSKFKTPSPSNVIREWAKRNGEKGGASVPPERRHRFSSEEAAAAARKRWEREQAAGAGAKLREAVRKQVERKLGLGDK